MTPRQVLKHFWGYPDFRLYQEDIIKSIINREDTLAILPTGGGKSITFQVPALILPGLTLVISPLIALMQDQTHRLKELEISAEFLHASMGEIQIDRILDNCIFGNTKLLYISPERLFSNLFLTRLEKMQVSFLAVDEAHCISEWGFDFRPSYLKINKIRTLFPDIPILALTATATPKVRKDIQTLLGFRRKHEFISSFKRSNIFYEVIWKENKLSYILERIKSEKGSVIIYTRTRKGTFDIAQFLNRNSICSGYYHAGLNFNERAVSQENWIQNKVQVMVATNAFGMGIDKPDVRLVIHFSLPDSLEAYYQESGRAGRDGKPSKAILLFEAADQREISEIMEQKNLSEQKIREVYEALSNNFKIAYAEGKNSTFDFNFDAFQFFYKISKTSFQQAINILEYNNLVHLDNLNFTTSSIQVKVLPESMDRNYLPIYQDLMVCLLRQYPGIYFDSIEIRELELAKKLNLRMEELMEHLLALSNLGVLNYLPRREQTQITFLSDRLPKNHFSIDMKPYLKLFSIQKEKLKRVFEYLDPKVDCRMNYLLDYFGEYSSKECGNCDRCSQQNNYSREIRLVLLEILDNKSIPISQISSYLDQFPSELVLKEVQELIDEGFVELNLRYELLKNKDF